MKTKTSINNKYITYETICQIRKTDPKRNYNKEESFPYNKRSRSYKARKRIHDILIQNYAPHELKFLTLTFDEEHNTLDRDIVKLRLYLFIRRINYHFKKKDKDFEFKYIAVLEKHKNKPSYHIHVICNLPFIDLNYDVINKRVITKEMKKQGVVWINPLQKIWNMGFVSLSDISNPKEMKKALELKTNKSNKKDKENKDILLDISQTIEYLCKYITKEFNDKFDDDDLKDELKGEYLYLMSKNWEEPKYEKEILTEEEDYNFSTKSYNEMKDITNDLGGISKMYNFEEKIYIYKFLIPTSNIEEFHKRMFYTKSENPKYDYFTLDDYSIENDSEKT